MTSYGKLRTTQTEEYWKTQDAINKRASERNAHLWTSTQPALPPQIDVKNVEKEFIECTMRRISRGVTPEYIGQFMASDVEKWCVKNFVRKTTRYLVENPKAKDFSQYENYNLNIKDLVNWMNKQFKKQEISAIAEIWNDHPKVNEITRSGFFKVTTGEITTNWVISDHQWVGRFVLYDDFYS